MGTLDTLVLLAPGIISLFHTFSKFTTKRVYTIYFFQDLDTIRFLQDRYPHLSFMFVCNKVDTSAETQTFDSGSGDDPDSDEEETRMPDGETSKTKETFVFSQLKEHGLLVDSDKGSCFFGISAKNTRRDRREHRNNSKARGAFAEFEDGLLAFLSENIRSRSIQAVEKLLLLQMSIFQAMRRTRNNLPGTLFAISLELDKATNIGKSLHDELMSTIAKKELMRKLVNGSLRSLREGFLSVADQYQLCSKRQNTEEELKARTFYFKNLVRMNHCKHQLPFSPKKEDIPFLRFLITIYGGIQDWTFNVLRRSLKSLMRKATDHVEMHTKKIDNLFIRQAFHLHYGSGHWPKRKSLPSGVDLTYTFASKKLREAVTKLLIDGLFHAMEWKSSEANFRLGDKQTRRKIIELILSKFNRQLITESLCEACAECLEMIHSVLLKDIRNHRVTNEVLSADVSQKLEEIAALYIPKMSLLTVQSFALNFRVTKGPITLGPVLKPTKHGQLHDCCEWANMAYPEAGVVKVIERGKVKPEIWSQTSVDLFNTM